jgi:hypothetical protein
MELKKHQIINTKFSENALLFSRGLYFLLDAQPITSTTVGGRQTPAPAHAPSDATPHARTPSP